MNESDPGLWKQLTSWLWALLAIPLRIVWMKADNAASKDELAAALDRMDKSNAEWRETTRVLFANAESDRRQFRESILTVTEKIHMAKNDVLIEIARGK